MSERDIAIVEFYRAGHSLRETGLHFGIVMQRVHQIVKRDAPEIMRRPHNTRKGSHYSIAHRQAFSFSGRKPRPITLAKLNLPPVD